MHEGLTYNLSDDILMEAEDCVKQSRTTLSEVKGGYLDPKTTCCSTDLSGEVIQYIDYIPYGETFVEQNRIDWSTPYRFNGKELDCESGLYYYRARYYDPKVSRFMSVDPMAEKYPSLSPYAYLVNNPINNIDTDGRYIVLASFAEKYKAITRYLNYYVQSDILSSDRILASLFSNSQGNLTRDKVIEAVSPNSAPVIVAASEAIGGDLDAEGVYYTMMV